MPTVTKAYPEDWEKVQPLLEEYANSSNADYQLLFDNYWQTPENHIGYILEESNKVVGFLACVFSQRENNKFCGLSTWVVNPAYRSLSLFLILEVIKLKNHTITSFTSIPDAIKILTKLGFKTLDTAFVYCPYRLNLSLPTTKIKVVYDHQSIREKLTDQDRRLFEDHEQFNATHLLFCDNNAYCYFIFKEKEVLRKTLFDTKMIYLINRLSLLFSRQGFIEKHVKVARLHYISNNQFFKKHRKQINSVICKHFGLHGLLIEQRFMTKADNLFCYKTMPKISLYKSKHLSPEEIDSLYTEMFILDY
ncbi:MAG: hypothetical protein ACQES1_11110 [Bacteroidota bacterium]